MYLSDIQIMNMTRIVSSTPNYKFSFNCSIFIFFQLQLSCTTQAFNIGCMVVLCRLMTCKIISSFVGLVALGRYLLVFFVSLTCSPHIWSICDSSNICFVLNIKHWSLSFLSFSDHSTTSFWTVNPICCSRCQKVRVSSILSWSLQRDSNTIVQIR